MNPVEWLLFAAARQYLQTLPPHSWNDRRTIMAALHVLERARDEAGVPETNG